MSRRDVVIRPMTEADHWQVFALWQETEGIGLGESDSPVAVSAYLQRNPGMSGLAVLPSEQIVGAALCGHDGRRGYLHHLAVARPFRRQGIARQLLAYCFAGLARCGIPKCNIFLFAYNDAGRAFWLREGWRPRPDLDVLQKPIVADALNTNSEGLQ